MITVYRSSFHLAVQAKMKKQNKSEINWLYNRSSYNKGENLRHDHLCFKRK